MTKYEEIVEKLKEKLSEKEFILAMELTDIKFSDNKLKGKYIQSIIDGYIDIYKELDDQKIDQKSQLTLIDKIAEKLKSGNKQDLLDVIDNYDVSNPKIRAILKQHRKKIEEIREGNLN
jgi:hypothetical protein